MVLITPVKSDRPDYPCGRAPWALVIEAEPLKAIYNAAQTVGSIVYFGDQVKRKILEKENVSLDPRNRCKNTRKMGQGKRGHAYFFRGISGERHFRPSTFRPLFPVSPRRREACGFRFLSPPPPGMQIPCQTSRETPNPIHAEP